METSFGCGIINNGMSSSGGRISLYEDYFIINGGIFDSFEKKYYYSDISDVKYTSIIHKIHFNCKYKVPVPKITVITGYTMNKILKTFKDNGVPCYPYKSESNRIILKVRDWFSFWYRG